MTGIEPWINLLIQIPLVGIFVWFTLERDKRAQANEVERDTQWRDFLKEQRVANNEALGRLAEEIKNLRIRAAANHD
jgi:hypothetical protein